MPQIKAHKRKLHSGKTIQVKAHNRAAPGKGKRRPGQPPLKPRRPGNRPHGKSSLPGNLNHSNPRHLKGLRAVLHNAAKRAGAALRRVRRR